MIALTIKTLPGEHLELFLFKAQHVAYETHIFTSSLIVLFPLIRSTFFFAPSRIATIIDQVHIHAQGRRR